MFVDQVINELALAVVYSVVPQHFISLRCPFHPVSMCQPAVKERHANTTTRTFAGLFFPENVLSTLVFGATGGIVLAYFPTIVIPPH
jgi:hypothetical protein